MQWVSVLSSKFIFLRIHSTFWYTTYFFYISVEYVLQPRLAICIVFHNIESKFVINYFHLQIFIYTGHFSEIRGLHSMNCSSKTIQLCYMLCMYKKTYLIFFCLSSRITLLFSLWMLIDLSIHKGKSKVARNEKPKKKTK